MMKRIETTTVTRRVVVTIGKKDLIKAFGLPKNAAVTFRTPGGYDCSNEDVEVDEAKQVLTLTYETKDVEEGKR